MRVEQFLFTLGCHTSKKIGKINIVNKNARKTPPAHIKAKILIGSKLEVARTKMPQAVVNVVSNIASPTCSYALVNASLWDKPFL